MNFCLEAVMMETSSNHEHGDFCPLNIMKSIILRFDGDPNVLSGGEYKTPHIQDACMGNKCVAPLGCKG